MTSREVCRKLFLLENTADGFKSFREMFAVSKYVLSFSKRLEANLVEDMIGEDSEELSISLVLGPVL